MEVWEDDNDMRCSHVSGAQIVSLVWLVSDFIVSHPIKREVADQPLACIRVVPASTPTSFASLPPCSAAVLFQISLAATSPLQPYRSSQFLELKLPQLQSHLTT